MDQGVAGLGGSSTNNGMVRHLIQNEKYSLSGRDVMELRSLQFLTPSKEDTSSPDEDEGVESVDNEPSGDIRKLQVISPPPSMEDTSSPDEEEMNHP
jgi:hypothetical protein